MVTCISCSKGSKRSQRGFTLIELLVVIAIISILASILFPVFARARENARRSSCASNLKQIGLSVMQYTQDYDEKYPMAYQNILQTTDGMPGKLYRVYNGPSSTGEAHYVSWMDLTHPYTKSLQVYVCPSQSTVPDAPAYGYNRYISNLDQGGLSLASIQRPSENVMLLDYNIYFNTYANPAECGTWVTLPPSHIFYRSQVAHLGGTNIAYADGHVKWITAQNGAVWNTDITTNRYWNPALP
jgi:prepilin-type N-terminal cleavage/methylation domain-containing protein/prepilin-type processing-associated H-X9-DG protein